MTRICVGVLCNTFNYSITRLVKTFFGYRIVYVDSIRCGDVSVAKNVALSKFENLKTNVPVVIDRHGSYHYYHPKFRKWYKDLDEKQLDKYFNWLSA